ncbi:MAG: hypothetical protein ACYS8L_04680 [Planctomycetota bacterium]
MLALDLTMMSLALLAAAAVAFTRHRRMVLMVCGGLFVPTAGLTTMAVWWTLSPTLAVLLLSVTLGLPLLALILYAVDLTLAPFCLEMTYLAMLCWILWPVLVMVNFLGLLLA